LKCSTGNHLHFGLELANLKNHFIEHGIRIGDAINIADTINRIIMLVKWYKQNDPKVLEHELRSFMVIPFLLSLGWSEQKIKIEYNKIDIALFEKSYTTKNKNDPIVIIETKTFDDGLSLAKNQIEYYVENYPQCSTMVTTNGYRYYIYLKGNGIFELYSYFNLLDMREFDYIENSVTGILEGIISLSNY
jgi:hypothetical protein